MAAGVVREFPVTKTRYYLHIRDDNHFIEDPEGFLASDFNAARAQAVCAASELMGEGLLTGALTLARGFELADEVGQPLAMLPFSYLLPQHFGHGQSIN